jgi:hypothetical protein
MVRAAYAVSSLHVDYRHSDGTWVSLKSKGMEVTIDRAVAIDGYHTSPQDRCTIRTTDEDGDRNLLSLSGHQVRVLWGAHALYRGVVSEVHTDMTPNGTRQNTNQQTVINCLDTLSLWRDRKLSRFPLWTETAMERLVRVLTTLGYPTSFIQAGPTGFGKVMAGVARYTGGAFDILDEIADAVHARFYTSATNTIRMRTSPAPIQVTFSNPATGAECEYDFADPGKDRQSYISSATAHNSDPAGHLYHAGTPADETPSTAVADYPVGLADSEIQNWLNELALESTPPALVSRVESHDTSLLNAEPELTGMCRVNVGSSPFYGAITGLSYRFDTEFSATIDLTNPAFFHYSGYASEFDPPEQPDPDESSIDTIPSFPVPGLGPDGGRILIFTLDDTFGEGSGAGSGGWDVTPTQAVTGTNYPAGTSGSADLTIAITAAPSYGGEGTITGTIRTSATETLSFGGSVQVISYCVDGTNSGGPSRADVDNGSPNFSHTLVTGHGGLGRIEYQWVPDTGPMVVVATWSPVGSGTGGGWVQPGVEVNSDVTATYYDSSSHADAPAMSLFYNDVPGDFIVDSEVVHPGVTSTDTLYTLDTAISGGTTYATHWYDGPGSLTTTLTLTAHDLVVVCTATLAGFISVPFVDYADPLPLDFQFGTGHVGSGDPDDPSAGIFMAIAPTDGDYEIQTYDLEKTRMCVYVAGV